MAKQWHRFFVTIETDDEVMPILYPNWQFNYDTTEEFANQVAKSWATRSMVEFGFNISVVKEARDPLTNWLL